jgi:DNA-binding MarR family transcriptional regulator
MSARAPTTTVESNARPPVEPAAVADRLHSTAIHLLRRLRRLDTGAPLTPARLSALSVVVFGGPLTIGQLAEAEQVSAPTMTRLAGALEQQGLVRRVADREDGRLVWLEATSRGTRLMHAGRRRRVAALTRELERLEPQQLALLNDAAELLAEVTARVVTGK